MGFVHGIIRSITAIRYCCTEGPEPKSPETGMWKRDGADLCDFIHPFLFIHLALQHSFMRNAHALL